VGRALAANCVKVEVEGPRSFLEAPRATIPETKAPGQSFATVDPGATHDTPPPTLPAAALEKAVGEEPAVDLIAANKAPEVGQEATIPSPAGVATVAASLQPTEPVTEASGAVAAVEEVGGPAAAQDCGRVEAQSLTIARHAGGKRWRGS
jgi:hypothetical protein